MSTQTHFTPTEACTLIAYEAVSLLNTVETQLPQCVQELRTAVEAFSGIHDLGKDGEALLEWLDMEIAAAQRFVDDGVSLPNLIDMERLDMEPDAVAQMDLVWLLFGTAAKEDAVRNSGRRFWAPRGRLLKCAGWMICCRTR